MNAEKLDKLTDSELNELTTVNRSINDRQQKGEITIEQALVEAKAVYAKLAETFDPSIPVSPLRRLAWEQSNNLIEILEAEKFDEDRLRGLKFPAGSILDIEARTRIQETRVIVNSMTLNGKRRLGNDEFNSLSKKEREEAEKEKRIVTDERHALIRIAMLSDYGKYIDENHTEMKKLRQAYHDRCLSNYEDYAKSKYRSTTRDNSLANKVSENIKLGKYSNEALAKAVVNMLQPVI